MSNTDGRQDLMQKGVGAAIWGAFGAGFRIILQVASQIVLARLLGPEAYGIFAVSLTIVLCAGLFSDFGLAYGLIQRTQVDDTVIRYVFTWQIILGLLMTVIVFAAAPLFAHLLGDPRVIPVVRWLSLSCIIASLGTTAGMLMRRNLDFKTLNIAAVVSYAIGFLGLGIPMALLGYGVWSLVAANLAQLAIAAAITFLSARHAIRPLFVHPDRQAILGFGTTVLATNLLNWLMMSVDRLVIGATMQATATGLYSTISNLMVAPVSTSIAVLQSALYSTSARAQDNTQRLQTALKAVLGSVALLLAPIFFAIGTTAETFVVAFYGSQWVGGGSVLRPIAFGMPAFLLMGMAIPSLWASGRTQWEFRLQVPLALLWTIVLLAVGSYGSLQLLSWAVCLWFYLRALVILMAACRALNMKFIECLKPMGAGLAVTIIVSIAAAAADHMGVNTPLLAELEIIVICAVTMVLGLIVVQPLITDEVRRLLDKVLQRLPPACGRVVLRRFLAAPPGPAV